jgi:KUP system potassium uptake protein
MPSKTNILQTTRLGHAYGVCVIMVTFITTSMIALVALIVWRLNWLLVLLVWLPFITLDGLFLSSALTKVPDGAWFTILLAMLLSSIFVLWRYGKEQQWAAEGKGRSDLTQLVLRGDSGNWKLPVDFGGRNLTNIKGKFTRDIELVIKFSQV